MTDETPANAPVKPGDLLAGKYRVDRVLGQGGMGVVVAATHTHLGQRVALKFLLPDLAARQDIVARFDREARAAVRIQSEHVARVLDTGVLESGAPYMVMEFLEGQDLQQLVRARGRLEPAEAAGYILQACECLAEAHVAGIVHRDIKPANLFLTRRADGSPLVKVLDFGISKANLLSGEGPASAPLTQTAAMMGSPKYMSPEQLKSSRDVDARTDIWALGVVLHELLTGEAAFLASTMAELCMAILSHPPPPLRSRRPDAPAGIEAAILRCLEKEPARRYPSVAEFAVDLAEFAPHERVSAERVLRVLQSNGQATQVALPPPAAAGAQGATATAARTATTASSVSAAHAPPAPQAQLAQTAPSTQHPGTSPQFNQGISHQGISHQGISHPHAQAPGPPMVSYPPPPMHGVPHHGPTPHGSPPQGPGMHPGGSYGPSYAPPLQPGYGQQLTHPPAPPPYPQGPVAYGQPPPHGRSGTLHPSTIALIVLVSLLVLGIGSCSMCVCLGAAAGG
ncbi:protein kinase domain-containing protein [Chondromyces apiculatus]|uniref:Serine/threonine-protein kinase pkn3 n=1 Tax=Chondromyces apiculatus DSM 436 TaxID=1192034 RepID=A0A017TGH6_9BACT|nr:protein kinase [Chondromyces apiculatus]EYF07920.1 Serine/threonine-protein kinase pkn3 [Chondromyces apiculatus DSM 436]